MNLDKELRKPLFFRHGRAQTLLEASASRPQRSLHGFSSSTASASSAVDIEMVNEAMEKLASEKEETEQLVISRLNAVPEAKFRFLDGRVFSGAQAAEEVKKHTKEGDFFLRLEKRAIEIVLKELQNAAV